MSNQRKGCPGMWKARPLRVLVDMDMVLCDLESHFLCQYRMLYPEEPFIPLESRRTFYITDQYMHIREDLKYKTHAILETDGFFRDLLPIEGSVEAVKEMSGMDGVDVFICTSPMSVVTNCVKEKFEWVEKYFGRSWVKKTVVSKDKTIVAGDILIDDRPKISGCVREPTWEHILFTACHNKDMDIRQLRCKQRLDNWTDGRWREIIEEYKRKL